MAAWKKGKMEMVGGRRYGGVQVACRCCPITGSAKLIGNAGSGKCVWSRGDGSATALTAGLRFGRDYRQPPLLVSPPACDEKVGASGERFWSRVKSMCSGVLVTSLDWRWFVSSSLR